MRVHLYTQEAAANAAAELVNTANPMPDGSETLGYCAPELLVDKWIIRADDITIAALGDDLVTDIAF
jgi:hypothetical protein